MKRCGRCGGFGTYNLGPALHDTHKCDDCEGTGTLTPKMEAIALQDTRRYRKYSVTRQRGTEKVNNDTHIPLSEQEVAAIQLGRVRLANSSAIKQVTDSDGGKKYLPIDETDVNASMTCNAINVLDNMLEPYGYKFGTKTLELLG